MIRMLCIEATLPKHVPNTAHYQIVVFEKTSVYIPGDERSRTNPGHGYPASTEVYNTTRIYVTLDREVWLKDIQALITDNPKRNDYVALSVKGTTQVELQPVVKISGE